MIIVKIADVRREEKIQEPDQVELATGNSTKIQIWNA